MTLAVEVVPHHALPRGCAGKVRYRSLDAAQEAVLRTAAAIRGGDVPRPDAVPAALRLRLWDLRFLPSRTSAGRARGPDVKLRRRARHVEVFADRGGGWRWRVRAKNGEITASSESYTRRASAVRGARRQFPGLAIEDVT